MAENLQITADVYANTQPAARQIKAFSDKNLNNLRLNLAVNDSGLKKGSTGLGQIRNDADQFTKSMAAANARVLAFGTAVAVIETMRRSFLALSLSINKVKQLFGGFFNFFWNIFYILEDIKEHFSIGEHL